MAMQKRLGDGDVRAKFAFIAVDPVKFNDKELYVILRNVCAFENERIREGEISEFIVFVESGMRAHNPKPRSITNQFEIDGQILLTTDQSVKATIKEKLYHQSPAFRKSGQKSTHPPRWLTTSTLVLCVGSTGFLMDTVDLYLEREGILRDGTFELIKEVGTLNPGLHSHDNYISIDIAHKAFYRGYVEQLGLVSGMRSKGEDHVFTTDELHDKLFARVDDT